MRENDSALPPTTNRSQVEFYEEIEVSVASPYSVSLEPADPVVVIVGAAGGARAGNTSAGGEGRFNESTNTVTCTAVGKGAVNPVLEWRADGGKLNSQAFGIRTWEEEHQDGQQGRSLKE